MAYRALVFDAYGTLYDTQSVAGAVAGICGDKAALVTQLWRQKQLEYSWLRALMGEYRDFWSVTRDALDYALDAAGIAADATQRDRLMAKYLTLDLHPDARAALASLASARLAILSNGSKAMLDALVEASGLAGVFEAVISVDAAKTFKPDPACYRLAVAALSLAKDEILFVSSNGFDVAGAKHFGFAVAWIDRGGSSDQLFSLQRGRAERLGHDADFRVSSLADLPKVLVGPR